MKKLLIILLIMMMSVGFVAAQVDYSTMEDSFEEFSANLAQALPYASTTGLNWSNAYLGNFPRFGIGLTTGFVSLPSEGFEEIASVVGVNLPSLITDFGIGVPLPAYTVDARLALPLLPVDVGVKGGVLTPSMTESLLSDVGVDYLLLGGDVRWGLMKDGVVKPAVSVGLGYNYIKGGLYMDGVTPGQTYDLPNTYGATSIDQIVLSDGDLYYEWEAHVIDAKVQVSKNIFILTPSVGAGYSYGFSTAGGGIDASITDGTNGDDLSSEEISAIENVLGMDLSSNGLSIFTEDQSGSLRVWGGCSFNIVVLKLDLTATYNITSQSLGAALNARVQL